MREEVLEQLRDLRQKLAGGQNATQSELDSLQDRFLSEREHLRPRENAELLRLVGPLGKDSDLVAPRWLCHLLGLRHKTVHVLLTWLSPNLGEVYVLQVRSWTKSDSPGHVDISVGGHVVYSEDSLLPLDAVYRELNEELGLAKSDLQGNMLIHQGGYDSYDEDEENSFFNSEWRDVYVGTITSTGFNKVKFSDGEVSGLYLCPSSGAPDLLTQRIIPLGNALQSSLDFCIRNAGVS